jgi:hypothetical protein
MGAVHKKNIGFLVLAFPVFSGSFLGRKRSPKTGGWGFEPLHSCHLPFYVLSFQIVAFNFGPLFSNVGQ